MLDIKVKTSFRAFRLLRDVKNAIPSCLKKAAYEVWKDMRAGMSIPGNGKPSKPGTPPHKQRGRLVQSVLYGMDGDQEAVIGSVPRKDRWYGKLHEHGGQFQTKSPILKRYSAGDEGWAEFARNPRKVALVSQAQADRATKINKWLAGKAARARYYANRTDVSHKQDKRLYAEGFAPEYEGEKTATVRFPARPFARPALDKNLYRLPWAFKDSINGG